MTECTHIPRRPCFRLMVCQFSIVYFVCQFCIVYFVCQFSIVDQYLLLATSIFTCLLVTVAVRLTQLNQLEKIQQERHLKENISNS